MKKTPKLCLTKYKAYLSAHYIFVILTPEIIFLAKNFSVNLHTSLQIPVPDCYSS